MLSFFIKYSDFVLQEDRVFSNLYHDLNIKFYHPLNIDIYLDGHDPTLENSESFRVDELISDESREYFYKKKRLAKKVFLMSDIDHIFRALNLILEAKNKASRGVKYASNTASDNSTWVSRNMLLTGIVVLAFIGLHMYDFWVHEMTVKYIEGDMSGLVDPNNADSGFRYYEELREKFVSPVRIGIYVVAFILLALHLLHGFNSAFQSIGANNKYVKSLKGFSKVYAIGVPALFIFIAFYHHFTH